MHATLDRGRHRDAAVRLATRRRAVNGLATALFGLAALVFAVPVVAVAYAVVSRAGVVVDGFPAFFTEDIPAFTRRAGGGMAPAIVGTLIATALATALAVPLGVFGAVYLNEYGGGRRFARIVRATAMVMSGVPSIVVGLFVYLVWTLRFGYSAFGGALALACLMLPIVIASAESALRHVPDDLREASLALGATRARTIVSVVLPAALPGLVSGALLAVARAAGETAPLLFALGAAKEIELDAFGEANTALSVQVFQHHSELAFPAAAARAWGAATTLVALSFTLMLAARAVAGRATRRAR